MNRFLLFFIFFSLLFSKNTNTEPRISVDNEFEYLLSEITELTIDVFETVKIPGRKENAITRKDYFYRAAAVLDKIKKVDSTNGVVFNTKILYNNPKVLIFEITDLLSDNSALKDFRIYGYKSNEISKLLKKNYPKLYYSSIVSNIFIFNNSTFFNSIQKIFVKYKYKSLTGEINKTNFPSEKKTFTKKEFSKQNINSLKRIIKLCEEKKIKLILVIAPFYSEKLNYEKKEFDLWKSNIKKNINNIEIIDFSLSFTNKKFFNDWKHINKKGTQEFNKIFFKNRIISDILL